MTLTKSEIERIRQEAILGARKYADLETACPYPFHTEAGIIFAIVFMVQRSCKPLFSSS